jgi:hypothetical protein
VLLPDKKPGLVDQLALDGDVALENQRSRVMDRVGHPALLDLRLQSAVQEVLWRQRKNIVELLLVVVEDIELGDRPLRACASCRSRGASEGCGRPSGSSQECHGPAIARACSSDRSRADRELAVDALLFVRTHGLLEGAPEVVTRHWADRMATTVGRH